VQVIPHITEEIKNRIRRFKETEVVMIEVGGTVGDIENRVFIEALRQMSREPENDFLFIHLSYVPVIISGEQKTKPTQHSVKELLALGIQPDVIIGRCEEDLTPDTKKKIALFCGVSPENVLSNPTIDDIYLLPLVLKKQNLGNIIVDRLKLKPHSPFTSKWDILVEGIHKTKEEVTLGIVGKYTGLEDAYLSIKEAFKHAGAVSYAKVNLKWIESDEIRKDDLIDVDGLLVPGGFGSRGVEGKIAAIKYAREHNLPFLGICFGMQLAVVEYARNVCNLSGANSTEVDEKTPHPVIDLIPEQKDVQKKGATMRLGAYPCVIKERTLAQRLYNTDKISERHRHRWEVNPQYIEVLEDNGLVFSGKYPNKNLMEICELTNHRYFIACQFHPEFKSRLENPAPLFAGLVRAAVQHQIKGE
jgi:CTP synthase